MTFYIDPKFCLAAILLIFAVGCGQSFDNISQEKLHTCSNQVSCDSNSALYAMDKFSFSLVTSGEVSLGYDLDDVVSGGEEDLDCGAQDYVSPDGRTGIDNRLGGLLEALGPIATDTLPATIQSLIDSGLLMFVLETVGSQNLKEKPPSGLVLRAGDGVPLLGADGNFLSGQTIELEPQPSMGGTSLSQAIADGYLFGPFEPEIRLVFLDSLVRYRLINAHVEMRQVGQDRVSGLFAAYVSIEDVLGTINFLRGDEDDEAALARSLLPSFADIQTADGNCDGLSIVFEFEGSRVYPFEDPNRDLTAPLTPLQLFERATCKSCHPVSSIDGSLNEFGPPLDGLGTRAGNTVAGQDAETYVRLAITDPKDHVVPGYTREMNTNVSRFLSDAELDILVGWLLTF